MSKILQIDPQQPDPGIIAAAAETIKVGGVVVIPTRHLYGLAVDAMDTEALKRVFAIKARPRTNPLLVLVKSRADLPRQVRRIPKSAQRLMDRFWPGRLTLVFEARDVLPEVLTGSRGTVGIRLSGNPVCQALLNMLPHPVTATSANRSGEEGCHRVTELPIDLQTAVDLILDAGPLPPGPGSTVVDVTRIPPRVLREGVLGEDQIAHALHEPL